MVRIWRKISTETIFRKWSIRTDLKHMGPVCGKLPSRLQTWKIPDRWRTTFSYKKTVVSLFSTCRTNQTSLVSNFGCCAKLIPNIFCAWYHTWEKMNEKTDLQGEHTVRADAFLWKQRSLRNVWQLFYISKLNKSFVHIKTIFDWDCA